MSTCTYHPFSLNQQKAVDNAKLSQYTAGNVRKSRREKEQEAAEAKKREEEANAAKAYADFLDAFEGDSRRSESAFIRADSKTAYNPLAKPLPQGPRADRKVWLLSPCQFSERRISQSPSPPPSVAPKPKGKRAMDDFLKEIKRWATFFY